jgi:hypothetical protein
MPYKINNIISCGCSWAEGAELVDNERPFGDLVAKQLGARHYPQGESAASIPHVILQLRSALDSIDDAKGTVVLLLLPGPDRDLMWSCTRPRGTGFMKFDPPPYDKPRSIFLNGNDPLHKDWFRDYHSPELAQYRANTVILALQQICHYHDLIDYYAWAYDRVDLWPEIDTTRFYGQGKLIMRDDIFLSTKKNHNIKHPDQFQHQLMADRFIEMIQNN